MSLSLILVVLAVAIFDFTNGFHDAADMVATAIASRAMRPGVAIVLVSVATFIAPFSVGLAVADTIGTFIDLSDVSVLAGEAVIVSALLAAVTYNVVTWLLGFPSSSSNSLAGGLVGGGLGAVGADHIAWGVAELKVGQLAGFMKVIAGLIASPVLGLLIGFVTMRLFLVVFRRFNRRIAPALVWSQYFSVAGLGFSHGANDAQKGMAIIGMMLIATGASKDFTVPWWATFVCATSITAGTVFGGWRIIKTLGFGLYRIRTIHAVANQAGAAVVNGIATALGAPTSTTQVVTATLVGNGAAEKPRHVKWRTVMRIVAGWWFNIPISAAVGWLYCTLYLTVRG